MEKTISVVGLGKLGAPLAACLAAKGMRVIGVDADPRKVEAINAGRAPLYEPQLEEFIRKANGRLTATSELGEAVAASEITFIVVATPSEHDGGFSLRHVLPVCREIGRALRAKPGFHLVVLTSTVMPGMTGGPVRGALEEASGKAAGRDFGLCYGHEFSALGLDARIGTKYLKGAISYGGPCFPRDNHALAALAKEIGAPADLAEVTDRFNRAQVQWLADLVQSYATPHCSAGILGLTYKPYSDVVEEAPGLLLAKELARRGVSVVAYDPTCDPKRMKALDSEIRWAETAEQCVEQSGVVVLATPWRECCLVPTKQWARHSAARTVIDCWRALGHLEGVDGVHYVRLGLGGEAARPLEISSSAR